MTNHDHDYENDIDDDGGGDEEVFGEIPVLGHSYLPKTSEITPIQSFQKLKTEKLKKASILWRQ